MRSRNFLLFAETKTSSGLLSEITASSIVEEQIGPTNVTFAGLLLKGDADENPYGNVNVFSDGRNIAKGSVTSITFEKSEVSLGTTDSADIVIVIARG